jgi:hypothetical protein
VLPRRRQKPNARVVSFHRGSSRDSR